MTFGVLVFKCVFDHGKIFRNSQSYSSICDDCSLHYTTPVTARAVRFMYGHVMARARDAISLPCTFAYSIRVAKWQRPIFEKKNRSLNVRQAVLSAVLWYFLVDSIYQQILQNAARDQKLKLRVSTSCGYFLERKNWEKHDENIFRSIQGNSKKLYIPYFWTNEKPLYVT